MSTFNGVYGGAANPDGSLDGYQGSYAWYRSSSFYDTSAAYVLRLGNASVLPTQAHSKYYGQTLRCVRNLIEMYRTWFLFWPTAAGVKKIGSEA